MLRSMTGFGRCYAQDSAASQLWEVRSVNGRHLDIKWRLPAPARPLEAALEKVARRHAARGRVEISLSLGFAPGAAPRAQFDAGQAAAMLDGLRALAQSRGEEFTADYSALLAVPSLWGGPEMDDAENLEAALAAGLERALEDWNESRQAEGARLARDLDARIAQMREWTAALSQAAPAVKEERIQALRDRLAAMLEDGEFGLSEDRFLQEVVILADRLDVSEELTRLGAHLEWLPRLLRDGRDAGRKLDFTLQECFREINTLGNKIQDASLARIVVDFKTELEKCREQAQNLE